MPDNWTALCVRWRAAEVRQRPLVRSGRASSSGDRPTTTTGSREYCGPHESVSYPGIRYNDDPMRTSPFEDLDSAAVRPTKWQTGEIVFNRNWNINRDLDFTDEKILWKYMTRSLVIEKVLLSRMFSSHEIAKYNNKLQHSRITFLGN